jgi:predicted Zn-dependent protease
MSAPARISISALAPLALLVVQSSCATVPITGRHQLNLIPQSEMLSMSESQYTDFLKTNTESNDAAGKAMVVKVGTNIQHAVETYMDSKGLGDKIKGFHWEFHLVESKEVNAWCMPGGKVVVYTGILPVTKDETGLAVVAIRRRPSSCGCRRSVSARSTARRCRSAACRRAKPTTSG